jgi:hypothetical protein
MHAATPFKWRHFEAEIILLCVRWYLRYALSYRDLEEMMAERGLHVDHTTIYRSRPTRRTRAGETLSYSSQDDHGLLARGRDVYQGEKDLGLPLSSRGFARQDPRILPECHPSEMHQQPGIFGHKHWGHLTPSPLASSRSTKTPRPPKRSMN